MKITIINDHDCDLKRVAEFVYKAIDEMLSKGRIQFYVITLKNGNAYYANITKTKTSLTIKVSI